MYADKLLIIILVTGLLSNVIGFGINWGTRERHQLSPKIVLNLLKDNGFDKVKLFETNGDILSALSDTGIQVIAGIPNDMLANLAGNPQVAVDWVNNNVFPYVSGGRGNVDIRYVAVGNEPFLKSYADMFIHTTVPALQNVQSALNNAGLGNKIKATVPLNADVYLSDDEQGRPSAGHFRDDIQDIMFSLTKFLNDNASPMIVNIYPFIMVYEEQSFPYEYAFFDGKFGPMIDGTYSYTNALIANYDTLIVTLEKNGFPNLPVIIGEAGWPTDGAEKANVEIARRFNQGLINWILQGKGTPRRPTPPDVYMFSLIDEDEKDTSNDRYYERHWGLFYNDGSSKYKLDMGNGKTLVPAKGVNYLEEQWCVLSPSANPTDPRLEDSKKYACDRADCSSLYNSGSCSKLDDRNKVSYAFNAYYQAMNQSVDACVFDNLATIVAKNPSQNGCRFDIMIDVVTSGTSSPGFGLQKAVGIILCMLIVFISVAV